MPDPETEQLGGRLEQVALTPAKKGIENDGDTKRYNIIIVPGGLSTAPKTPTQLGAPTDSEWPWLDSGPDGPAAKLASFLSLRMIPSRTYIFDYSVPQRREGITTDALQKLAHDFLDELVSIQIISSSSFDALDREDDYAEEDEKGNSSDEPQGGTGRQDGSDLGDAEEAGEAEEQTGNAGQRGTPELDSPKQDDRRSEAGETTGTAVFGENPQTFSGDDQTEKMEQNDTAENQVADGNTDGKDEADGDNDRGGSTEDEAEDDKSNSEESTSVSAGMEDLLIFVAQDLGGLLVKKALSTARTTIGHYQGIAACTTLVLFYATPCPFAVQESSLESLANGLLCTTRQSMLFSSVWIQNTAHMIESVCADFVLSEPIYHVINVRCSAQDLVPFLQQNAVANQPSLTALMSLGEEILALPRTPLGYWQTLNSLALTLSGLPRISTAAVVFDALQQTHTEALRKEPGVVQWTRDSVFCGFAGFIVPTEDKAAVLFEILQKDAAAANSSDRLQHLTTLDELTPIDEGYSEKQKKTTTVTSKPKSKPTAVITYVFDPYNLDTDTATALLASLCYQLICFRRDAFVHASELTFYLRARSEERIWPFDKLLILFRALLSCPHEGTVACILWEMPGTVLPQGLVSTLAVLASGAQSTFKLAVISSRTDVEFPSTAAPAEAPAKLPVKLPVKLPAFPALLPPSPGLSRAPTWAADDANVFRLPHCPINLAGIVDRELASLLTRHPAMKIVLQKLKEIILADGGAASPDDNSCQNICEDRKSLFSGSHAEVVASVRTWLELISRRAAPISIASIVREAPKMPTTMASLYAATLSYTPPALLPTVQHLLAWLCLAKRPMTLAELAIALAVAHAPGTGQISGVDEPLMHAKTMDEVATHTPVNVQDDLLSLLGSAVHMDSSGRPLLQAELIELLDHSAFHEEHSAFHHGSDEDSVYKYALPDAHDRLACICLSYLRLCQIKYPDMDHTLLKNNPFSEYAILHWPYHYAAGRPPSRNAPRPPAQTPHVPSCDAYFNDASLMQFWAELYHSLRHPGLTPPQDNIALCMAADVGCVDLIRHVLQYTLVDKAPGTTKGTEKDKAATATRSALSRALLYAIQHGDRDAIELLEAAGAKSRYSVHVAVASNQNALINHFGPLSDAVDVEGWRGSTPPQIAAATGNVDALDAFFNAGLIEISTYHPESEAKTTEFDSIKAYIEGFYEISYLSILHIACLFGHAAAVKRLLEKKSVDPNGLDAYRNRPIFYACLVQQPDTLRALLEDTRTDPSLVADSEIWRTPIQVAALHGRVDMLELLVDNLQSRLTADVATDNDVSDTSDTSASPKSALVGALLKKDHFGLTALHLAALQGHVNAGKMLLDHDASGSLALQTAGEASVIPLHFAARHDHTEFMRLLLSLSNAAEQLSAVRTDHQGQTALHISARYGGLASAMRVLIDAHGKAKLSLNTFDSGPSSALQYAVLRGSVAHTRLLLDGGATLDVVDQKAATPLLLACKYGFSDVVRLLLDRNADASLSDSTGLTPLRAAAQSGSVPTMQAILETLPVSSLKEADEEGKNALHYAAMSNSYEAVVFVLQQMGRTSHTSRSLHSTVEQQDNMGAQALSDLGELLLDGTGGTMPIEAAAESGLLITLLPAVEHHIKEPDALYNKLVLRASAAGQVKNVKFLVSKYYNGDLDAVDADGRTALSHMAETRHFKLVRDLARKTKPGSDNDGRTPLIYAIKSGQARVVDALLSYGHEEELDMTDDKDQSPLYLAAYNSEKDIVRQLLEHKADPNTAESNGKNTALHAAVLRASVGVVSLIANAPGVQGYARNNDDRTPMCIAADMQLLGEARALLAAGWKGNGPDSYRHRTPLHDACTNEELIRLLVEEGDFDVNAVDSFGQTALHCACDLICGQVSLLLDLGANPMIADDEQRTCHHMAAWSKDHFMALMQSKSVPSLSELKSLVDMDGVTLLDKVVRAGNTTAATYLLDAQDSPFRAVEQGIDGEKYLEAAIRCGNLTIIQVLLERAKDCVHELPDEIKRKHVDTLLKAIFAETPLAVSRIEGTAKRVLSTYMETQDGSELARREAWPYFLLVDNLLSSDRVTMHVRRPFQQLTYGTWAEIRDRSGWTYPQLLDAMVPFDDATSSTRGDDDDELPPDEDHHLYGLEEVVVTDEDRAMFGDRPDTPKLPTSWLPAASHSDLIWRRPPADDPSTSEMTDKEVADDTASETTDPESDSAPHLYACASPSMDYYDRSMARSDYPIPPSSKYYFSIRVLDEGDEKVVGCGVGYGNYAVDNMPGWDSNGWGLHGDDGAFFHASGYGKSTKERYPYGTGAVVGVYVDTTEHRVFFAIDGKVLPIGFGRVYGRLYPIVGLANNASIEAAFGSPDGEDAFVDDNGHPLMDKVTTWL